MSKAMARPQRERTGPTTSYDNFVLKSWLQKVGGQRRRDILRKLKNDLENLGLSRREVRQGLIQLASKPRVVLWRQPKIEKHGKQKSPKRKRPGPLCKTVTYSKKSNIPFLEDGHRRKKEDEDEGKHNVTEKVADQSDAMVEKAVEKASTKNIDENRQVTMINREKNTNAKRISLFDSELTKIRKTVLKRRKIRNQEKSDTSKKPASVDSTYPLSKTKDKHSRSANEMMLSDKHVSSTSKQVSKSDKESNRSRESEKKEATENTSIQSKDKIPLRRTPELVADSVGTEFIYTHPRSKAHKIKVTLNARSEHIVRKKDTNQREGNKDFDDTINNNVSETCADVQNLKEKHVCSSQIENKTPARIRNVSEFETKWEPNKNSDENEQRKRTSPSVPLYTTQKRRKMDIIKSELNFINLKKERHIRKRFRKFFGNCTTFSEDEQEETILKKSRKKRRKKDSINSCDSGVCISEVCSTGNCLEILKEIQKAVPDSTMEEDGDIEKLSEGVEAEATVRTNPDSDDKYADKEDQVTCAEEMAKLQNNELLELKSEVTSTPTVTEEKVKEFSEEDSQAQTTVDFSAVSERTPEMINISTVPEAEINEISEENSQAKSTVDFSAVSEPASELTNISTVTGVEAKGISEETSQAESTVDLSAVSFEVTSISTVTETQVPDVSEENRQAGSTVDFSALSDQPRSFNRKIPLADASSRTSLNTTNKFIDIKNLCILEDDEDPEILFEELAFLEGANDIDSKDSLVELLNMQFNDSYQIETEGNMISIRTNAETHANQNNVNECVGDIEKSRPPREAQSNSSHVAEIETEKGTTTTETTLSNSIGIAETCVEGTLINNDTQNNTEVAQRQNNACATETNTNEKGIPEISNAVEGKKCNEADVPKTAAPIIVTIKVLSEDAIAGEFPKNGIQIITVQNDGHVTVNDTNTAAALQSSHTQNTIEEREDTPPRIVTQPRLRVRSSEELGSRWCPTPVRVDVPLVPTSVHDIERTSGTTAAEPKTSVAVSSTSSSVGEKSSDVLRSYLTDSSSSPSNDTASVTINSQITDNCTPHTAVRNCLLRISKHVRNIRWFKSYYSAYCKTDFQCQLKGLRSMIHGFELLLRGELEVLGKEYNENQYAKVADYVVRKLNDGIMKNDPLSYEEITSYVRAHMSSYSASHSTAAEYSNNNSNNDTRTRAASHSVTNESFGNKNTSVANSAGMIPKNNSSNITDSHVNRLSQLAHKIPSDSQYAQRLQRVNTHINAKASTLNQNRQNIVPVTQNNYQRTAVNVPHTNVQNMQQMPNNRALYQNTIANTTAYAPASFTGNPQTTQNVNVNTPQILPPHCTTSLPNIPHQSPYRVTHNPVQSVPLSMPVHHSINSPQVKVVNYPSMPISNHTTQVTNQRYLNTVPNINMFNSGQQYPYVLQGANPNVIQETVPVQSMGQVHISQNLQQSMPVTIAPHNLPQTKPATCYASQNVQYASTMASVPTTNNMLQETLTPVGNVCMQNVQNPSYATTIPAQRCLQNAHSSRNKVQTVLFAQKPADKESAKGQSKRNECTRSDMLGHLTTYQRRLLLTQILSYFNKYKFLYQYMTSEQRQEMQLGRGRLLELRFALYNDIPRVTRCSAQNDTKSVEKNVCKNVKNNPAEEVEVQILHSRLNSPPKDAVQINEGRHKIQQHTVQKENPTISPQERSELTVTSPEILEVIPKNLQVVNTLPKQTGQNREENEEESTLPENEVQNNSIESEASLSKDNSPSGTEETQRQCLLEKCLQLSFTEEERQNMNISQKSANATSDIRSPSDSSNYDQTDETSANKLGVQIVTVELSPENDEVVHRDPSRNSTEEPHETAVQSSEENKIEDCEKTGEEHHLISSSTITNMKDTDSEISTVSLHDKDVDTCDILSNTNTTELSEAASSPTTESLTEDIPNILDVRSIPLDMFEKMEEQFIPDQTEIAQQETEPELKPIEEIKCEVKEEESKICLYCSKPSTVLCEICLVAHYCSKRCSELHWKIHYENCIPHPLYRVCTADTELTEQSVAPTSST